MMTATMEAFRRSLEGKDRAEITEIAVSIFRAKKELEIRLKETENASSAMALEYQQMKDELNGARKEIDALRKQNQHLTGIQTIQTNDLFGRSTEKTEDILNQAVEDVGSEVGKALERGVSKAIDNVLKSLLEGEE